MKKPITLPGLLGATGCAIGAEEKAILAEVHDLGHGTDLLMLEKVANNLERETATGQPLTTSPGKLGNFTS